MVSVLEFSLAGFRKWDGNAHLSSLSLTMETSGVGYSAMLRIFPRRLGGLHYLR
jgi:hypothetical protein